MQPSLRSSSCRRVKKIPCDDVKKVSVKQSSASSMYIFNMYLCTSLWILLNILFCRAKCSVYRWLCFFHRSFKSQLGGKSVKWCLYTYSTVDNLSCLCVPQGMGYCHYFRSWGVRTVFEYLTQCSDARWCLVNS